MASRVNKSNLLFILLNIVTIALFNIVEMEHWMTQFFITLWLLITGGFLFVTGYYIKKLIHVNDVSRLLITYLSTYIFITLLFAGISKEYDSFILRFISFYSDKEIFIRLTLPYLLSAIAALLFCKLSNAD